MRGSCPILLMRDVNMFNINCAIAPAPPLPRSLCCASSVPLSREGRGKFKPNSLDGRGWSKGFAPHAARLRNGGPMQRAMRPARVGERVEISPYLIAGSIERTLARADTGTRACRTTSCAGFFGRSPDDDVWKRGSHSKTTRPQKYVTAPATEFCCSLSMTRR